MKQLIKNIKLIPILFAFIGIFSCEENAVELPKVVAGFTSTVNTDTGVVTFVNTSKNATTYEWDFGDTTTSTEKNPTHKYVAGSYEVTLKAKNSAGDSTSFKATVSVDIKTKSIPLNLPINFDGSVTYTESIKGNVSFKVIDNPQKSGINNKTTKVGSITNVGENLENAIFNLDTPISFATLKSVKLKVYSTKALPVKLKFEGGLSSAPAIDTDQSHGGTGWEDLTFTFTSSASYNKMVIFVDGLGTAAGTFYIDDIEQVASTTPPPTACTKTTLETPVDFDCEGTNYASKTVNNVSFAVIDNPQKSGVNNKTTKVGSITNAGLNWENVLFNLDTPISFATLKSVKLKVYSTKALPIKLKFEGGLSSAPAIDTDQNHGGTGWEELTFTFTSSASYSKMVIFVDGPGTAAGTFYIDDIEQVASTGGGGGNAGPTAAAPTPPTRNAAKVKSLFSDTYANITVSQWSASWDDSDVADVTVAGNNVKKVTFTNFLGVDFSSNAFDATTFTHFHMDYWVSDNIKSGQVLNPKWSNHASGREVNAFIYTNPVTKSGEWVSIDIPITDFKEGSTTRNNVAQFLLTTSTTIKEVYIDNIYFYKQ